MLKKFKKAARSAGARIALANAADGLNLSLHTKSFLDTLLRDLLVAFSDLPVGDQNEAGLLRVLDEACRGKPNVSGIIVPSSRLAAHKTNLAVRENYLSTVIHGNVLPHLMHEDDYDRLFGSLMITGLASGFVKAGSRAEKTLMDMSPAARRRRRFRMKSTFQFGNPILWLTRRSLVEQAMADAKNIGVSRADLLTDRLGLVYPKFDGANQTKATNQRYVVHIPIEVVLRNLTFRPTFVEAGSYPRFMVMPRVGTALPGWGRTLDLGELVSKFKLVDSMDEVTRWPIIPGELQDTERLEFDFLGSLTRPRGVTPGHDLDANVADLLMSGRRLATTIRSLRK